jgi:hypothetical protein
MLLFHGTYLQLLNQVLKVDKVYLIPNISHWKISEGIEIITASYFIFMSSLSFSTAFVLFGSISSDLA